VGSLDRREGVERPWVSFEPAQIADVDLSHRALGGPVELSKPGMSSEMRRQSYEFHKLIWCASSIHEPERLIVNVLNRVPVCTEDVLNVSRTDHWPTVAGHHELGRERTKSVHALIPLHRISELGATNRVQVRKFSP
jgi:hypothetical protein